MQPASGRAYDRRGTWGSASRCLRTFHQLHAKGGSETVSLANALPPSVMLSSGHWRTARRRGSSPVWAEPDVEKTALEEFQLLTGSFTRRVIWQELTRRLPYAV